MLIPGLFFLVTMVPNYSELPEHPRAETIDVCRGAEQRLFAKLNTYHAWIRKNDYANGGKLTSELSTAYYNEAIMALKPILQFLRDAPLMDAPADQCLIAEQNGYTVLSDIAGERFGESHGYVREADGTWSRQ